VWIHVETEFDAEMWFICYIIVNFSDEMWVLWYICDKLWFKCKKTGKRKQKNVAQLQSWTNFSAGPSFADRQTLPTAMTLLFADSLPHGLSAKNLRQLVYWRSTKTSPTALPSVVDEGLTSPSFFADWDEAIGEASPTGCHVAVSEEVFAVKNVADRSSPTGFRISYRRSLCRQDKALHRFLQAVGEGSVPSSVCTWTKVLRIFLGVTDCWSCSWS
jgi:hypothetical protein